MEEAVQSMKGIKMYAKIQELKELGIAKKLNADDLA